MTTRTRTHTRRRRWSKNVTEHSHALDVESGTFTQSTPHEIALSLKKSAEQSHSRKASPFRSAMSMLTFYMNRAGKNLSEEESEKLTQAKLELRKLFHRKTPAAHSRQPAAKH
jgi:hypothetical protein